MKLQKKSLGVGAVAVGAVLAFAIPAGAAVNLQSESSGDAAVAIAKKAQLKAHGAATVVTVNVTCPANSTFQVYVEVGQTVNPTTTTHGSASATSLQCLGYTQKVKIPVLAGGTPWKAGQAYATAELDVLYPTYKTVNTGRVIVNVDNG